MAKKESNTMIYAMLGTLGVLLLCKQYLFAPMMVKGKSMEPTYHTGDFVIINKVAKIHRFDQIVFKSKSGDKYIIKRVIGLPGDSVEMKDDVLYINGKPYEEPYVNRNAANPMMKRITQDFTLQSLTGQDKVPEGHLFVLGDNRLNSKDSRHYGFVPIDSVKGQSMVRVYPFNKLKWFKNEERE